MRRRRGRIAAAALVWLALAFPAPLPAAGEAMHLHVTERGDTLIGIGRRFLIDPARWPEIARANRLRDPNRIGTGVPIAIPLALMRTEPVPATVVGVTGGAQAGNAALQGGQTLPEGSELTTGADGHVTLRLVDGTVLRLRPGSQLRLSVSRRIGDTAITRTGARLDRGRVEIEAVPAPAGRPGFEIGTPQGVLGVRGTEFRVATGEQNTRGEVLEGMVAVDSRAGGPGQRVRAGFGTVVPTGAPVAQPVPLLPPPDLAGLPTLQERILMRFPLPPQPGATAWRAQIASDAEFDRVLADSTSAGPELRFGDLPDGEYVLRVRAIDAQGLEGQDATLRFRLKARPEAPLPSVPQPRTSLIGNRVEFAWAANPDAARYRLQLARDPTFAPATLVHDRQDLTGLGTAIEDLAPGTYHWRLASVRQTPDQPADQPADQGPWGVPQAFDLRPPPPQPGPPAVGDTSVRFAWEGRPGQRFEFQLARDAAFETPLVERALTEPAIELPLPGSGRFHIRTRAIEPDGFVGPWSTPQYFDLPSCLRDGSGECVSAGERPVIVRE